MSKILNVFAGSLPSVVPNDLRFLVLRHFGILALARGKGPDYGGYHRPVVLDLALQSVGEYLLLADHRGIAAIRRAIQNAAADVCHRKDPGFGLSHDAWTITVLDVAEQNVCYGHVGVCRALICRETGIEQITQDHSIGNGSSDADQSWRFVESRMLGFADEQVDVGCVELGPADVLLLVSPGVIASLSNETMFAVVNENRNNMEAIVNSVLQLSAEEHMLGVAVVAASWVQQK